MKNVKHADSDLLNMMNQEHNGDSMGNMNSADNNMKDFKEFIQEVNDNSNNRTYLENANEGFRCGEFDCNPIVSNTCCYNYLVHAIVCGYAPCP